VQTETVKRWQSGLAFVFGFLLTFGATVVIGTVGPSPLPIWALFLLVGWAIWSLPKLGSDKAKWGAIVLYSSVFLGLWLASNPRPFEGGIKATALYGLFACVALAAAIGTYLFASHLGKAASVLAAGRALLPLFACCWLVAFFSSSTGAAGHMLSFAMRHLGLSRPSAEELVLVVRKTIHFCFYGTLAVFAFRAARAGGLKSALAYALLFALAHASFDELRQSSYSDRTGSFWDVLLDMGGAVTFAGVAQATGRTKPTSAKT
jgi:VanZ family protein